MAIKEAMQKAIQAVADGAAVRSAAKEFGVGRTTLRNHLERVKRLESAPTKWTFPASLKYEVKEGSILIGGDVHFWPGERSLAWEAFVEVAQAIKPNMIVLNGDVLDGARVSRHPRLRGQQAPSIGQEIAEALKQLARLPNCELVWTRGNHDSRVDNYLANNAPELDDFAGCVADRFDKWRFGYAVMVNEIPGVIPVEIRHYFRTGVHSRHNNVMNAGIHMVTNHTHQLGVTPVNNRLGRIYGIETGMLGDVDGPQFEYHQNMPTRANAGFALLSFDSDGHLLPPELCEVVRGKALFRGAQWGIGEKPRYRVRAA